MFFFSENKPDENQIRQHQAEVEGAYNELLQLAAMRRARLEESLKLQSFYRNADEEEMWVTEKDYFVQSNDYGHDLNTAIILLAKHEVIVVVVFMCIHLLFALAVKVYMFGCY